MDTKRTVRNFTSGFQIGVITMCVTLGAPASGETRAVDHYESTKAVIDGETLYLISNDRQKLATAPLMEQGQATVLKLPVSDKENVPRCWDVMGETLYITRVHAGAGGPLDPSTYIDGLLEIPLKELKNWAAMAKRVEELKEENLVFPPNREVDDIVSGKLEPQYSVARADPIGLARAALMFGGINVIKVQDQPVCWTDMSVGTNRIVTIVAETKVPRRNAVRVSMLDIRCSNEIKNWISPVPGVVGPPMHGFVITETTGGVKKCGQVTLVSKDGSVCLFADDTLTLTDERIGAEYKAEEAEDNGDQIILVVDKRKKTAECFRFVVRDGTIKLLGKSKGAGDDAEIANALKKTVAVLRSREEGFVNNIKVVEADRSTIEKLTMAKARMRRTRSPVGKKGPRTLKEAAEFLLTSVSMACPPGACVEYNGFFFFSGGRSAKRETDFSSGFAIEKGSNEWYTWEADVERR